MLPQQRNTLYVLLTMKCNLNCEYCYIHSKLIKEECANIQSIAKVVEELKPKSVIFTGGEPMLYPELLTTAIDYCKDLDYITDLTLMTNLLYKRTPTIYKIFQKVNYIQTTLRPQLCDTNPEYLDNIKYCWAHGYLLSFMVTLSKDLISSYSPEKLVEYIDLVTSSTVGCPITFEIVSYPRINNETNIERYYSDADQYLLEIAQIHKRENKSWIFQNQVDIINAHQSDNTYHCNGCYLPNSYILEPGKSEVKRGCPCLITYSVEERAKKFRLDCLNCEDEIFKICKGDCERFGPYCGFPKRTAKYILETLK